MVYPSYEFIILIKTVSLPLIKHTQFTSVSSVSEKMGEFLPKLSTRTDLKISINTPAKPLPRLWRDDGTFARTIGALYNSSALTNTRGSSMRAEIAAHAEEIEQSLELLRRHL